MRISPFTAFIACLIIFASLSVFARPHIIDGDAVTYVDAIHVLNGMPVEQSAGIVSYTIHRVLTTFLGLEIINVLSFIFGSIEAAWLFWATILYFLVNILFYKLLFKIFKSEVTAAIGGLFFAANYAMVIFGLTYFMDIGGWFFYIFSIYFLYSYIQSGDKRDLWTAVLAASVGGFFKENALVAYVPIFFTVFYESWPLIRTPFALLKDFLKKIIPITLVVFVPFIIHNVSVFIIFHDTYFHWIQINHDVYHYNSRIVEYIKSFGSLLNFLIPISLAGLWMTIKSFRNYTLDMKTAIFIVAVFISSAPAVMWPGITQRVLFMVVPGTVILAGFFIKRYEKYWAWFIPVIIIYALSSFFMDSFILNAVNLPF